MRKALNPLQDQTLPTRRCGLSLVMAAVMVLFTPHWTARVSRRRCSAATAVTPRSPPNG